MVVVRNKRLEFLCVWNSRDVLEQTSYNVQKLIWYKSSISMLTKAHRNRHSPVRKTCAPIGQSYARSMSQIVSAFTPTCWPCPSLVVIFVAIISPFCKEFGQEALVTWIRLSLNEGIYLHKPISVRLTANIKWNQRACFYERIPNTICHRPIDQKRRTLPLHEIGFC